MDYAQKVAYLFGVSENEAKVMVTTVELNQLTGLVKFLRGSARDQFTEEEFSAIEDFLLGVGNSVNEYLLSLLAGADE